ncbi:MAG TPA: 2-dehydro-3-deoxy-6-phosphogalactonate aldolase [Casimicrobiaceae bacterium]|jgi:2-dehydro-3-deoxyphosphogalactonate aldolase|nr:2-dehydro-3-deoxy-6-phosphogalactonate aldolase [Casimicrobiaceae bacterium]
MNPLAAYLSPLPLIAVLRGIAPEEVDGVGDALVDAGFRVLEVPLNSPRPYDSIGRLAQRFGATCLIGAGTVLDVADVARVREAGGRIVVMPHADLAIVREAKRLGMVCCPGVATPTEAFAALAAGADGLKMFPAEALPPPVLKAWRAVLPKEALVFAVGGIRPDTMQGYWSAGASGFGTGSNLYKPGADPADVRRVAGEFAAAFAGLKR